jgi:Flp pilus assembly CpaE family ATPase
MSHCFWGCGRGHSVLTALDHLAWIDPAMLSAYVVEHECGVHVLAAGDEFGRPGLREADAVEQTLRALNAIYDYVILDIGTSLMMPAPAALQLSDHILLVANPDVPCLRNLQRLIDAVKTAGVPGERLQIVLNRASESGVLSTAQIERVIGLNINFSVNSDYRTVASAVNSGVPVSSLRASDMIGQLDAIARSIAGFPEVARPKSGIPLRGAGGLASRRGGTRARPSTTRRARDRGAAAGCRRAARLCRARESA